MSKQYFTVEEFTHSDNAIANNVDNTPNDTERRNIEATIQAITPIRIAWGAHVKTNWPGEKEGINVTSGFRNQRTNELTNGSKTSAHLIGFAADLQPANGRIKEFQQFIINWISNAERTGFLWDQLIIEKNSKGSEWVHFGLKNQQGLQRKQKFTLNPK